MDGNLLDFISGFGNKQIAEIGLLPLGGLLVISLVSSFLVSYLYVHFYRTRSTGSQIHKSFPLLGLSITSIFICIQFSLPLSLGLLGALSIVRFRTPVKEPEEIGFLMLLIATSISCATFNLAFLGIILLMATIGLLVARYGGVLVDNYFSSGMLSCTFPQELASGDSFTTIVETISTSAVGARVDSISEDGEYGVISANFHKLQGDAILSLKKQLAEIDGRIRVDIYYNNQVQ